MWKSKSCCEEVSNRFWPREERKKNSWWSSHPLALLLCFPNWKTKHDYVSLLLSLFPPSLPLFLSPILYFPLPRSPGSAPGYVSQSSRKYCGGQIKWWTTAKIIPRVPHCYCFTGGGECRGTSSSLCVCRAWKRDWKSKDSKNRWTDEWRVVLDGREAF